MLPPFMENRELICVLYVLGEGFGNGSVDKVGTLGVNILVNTFKECEFVRAEILDIVLSRVIFKNAPTSHSGFSAVLQRAIAENPHAMLEHVPKVCRTSLGTTRVPLHIILICLCDAAQ
jgi:hypothetical protein